MGLSSRGAHLVVVILGIGVAIFVYGFFSGEGAISLFFLEFDRESLAILFAVASFGAYGRWCYELPIRPNEQGIQLFLGAQTGVVWKESNFLFVPRPFWSIWKRVSVQHFSFTVASQNRTQEGHSMMVFATGRVIPNDAYLLAKISEEGLREQVLGLSMTAIASYIHHNKRNPLLKYPVFNLSETIKDIFNSNKLYGLDITLFTTKVLEVSQETMKQFDFIARQTDMENAVSHLKNRFPGTSDIELYAIYASFVGINPAVMSYMVHGEGNKNIFVGGGVGNVS